MMEQITQAPLHIFYCYAREDKAFRDALDRHLAGFKCQHILTTWSDREIRAGEEWKTAIDTRLQQADVRTLYKNSDGRTQQPLPPGSFTGSGSALALDCEINQRAPLLQNLEVAKMLATYAHFATCHLLDGQKDWLRELSRAGQ